MQRVRSASKNSNFSYENELGADAIHEHVVHELGVHVIDEHVVRELGVHVIGADVIG